MLDRLKRGWRNLRSSPPGRRFQEQYERRHGEDRSPARKGLFIAVGIAILAAGIFFLPAPGPGTLVLLLGAGVIAEESLTAARLLDRIELRIRRLAEWALDVWRRLPLAAKVLLAALAIALAGGLAFGAYRLFLSR